MGEPRGHDPRGISREHVKSVGLVHPVAHDVNISYKLFKGVIVFKEVLNRVPDELGKERLHREEE
jgi:hypothetical protein